MIKTAYAICRTGIFLLMPIVLVSACASVPRSNGLSLDNDKPLQTVSEEQGRRVARYADDALLDTLRSYTLPDISLRLPEQQEGISARQLALIGNALNRSMCMRLGQYLTAETGASDGALRIEAALTGITPTSKAVSGLSAAVDTFVPGPFRIPLGMGAIALDAKATANGRTAAFMRWAKGANPVFNSAKVSTIGDAYALVDTFSREFGRLLLEGSGGAKKRVKLAPERIAVNEALCEARYGTVDPVGRGASFLLPLSPEFIDPGKPESAETDGTPPPETPTEPRLP